MIFTEGTCLENCRLRPVPGDVAGDRSSNVRQMYDDIKISGTNINNTTLVVYTEELTHPVYTEELTHPRPALRSRQDATAPLSCRSACKRSVQFSYRRPNQKPPLPRNGTLFGSVPGVGERWWSSTDLRRPSSNSVLHPLSPESGHETTIPIPLTRCLSPPAAVVCPACPQTSYPFPTSPQTLAPTSRKLQPNQTAVSDAPRTTSRIHLPTTLGRIRYSTSVIREQ
jgi:hypothetical protein